VEILAERAETVGRDPSRRESYDLVTARACAALPVLVEYALPLARVGGTLLAWKGRLAEAELEGGRDAAQVLGGDAPAVRPTGFAELGDHRFVVVPKSRPTPATYPRRAGQPPRRPLA
jgi:16S rRNA (guanine527-N7)-methyltransferase